MAKHKRFVVVMDSTGEVVRLARKTDGDPPEPRMDGYSVHEIGEHDPVQLYHVREPDGTYSDPQQRNSTPESTKPVSHEKQRGTPSKDAA